MHFILVGILFISLSYGLILPMTKTDGSLDVTSLLSHIALLEQTNQQSASEIVDIKSQLKVALDELKEAKTDLNNVKSDLKATQTITAVLQFQLKSTQPPSVSTDVSSEMVTLKEEILALKANLTVGQLQLQTALGELQKVKSDLRANEKEMAVLQSRLQSTHPPSIHTDVSSELASLKVKMSSLESASTGRANISNSGATFIRWGRTTCPTGNKMMYKGYTGGTHYSYKASTATILCLPDHPIYDEHTPGEQWSFIFGTEYQTAAYTGSHLKNLEDEDMPCVVCESETKTSVIMVPARNQCYPGWNLEYKGYLMGARHNDASAEFICIDNDAESIAGGQANMDGQILYFVESKCGSLPCPPYKDDWELTCAVCSQ